MTSTGADDANEIVQLDDDYRSTRTTCISDQSPEMINAKGNKVPRSKQRAKTQIKLDALEAFEKRKAAGRKRRWITDKITARHLGLDFLLCLRDALGDEVLGIASANLKDRSVSGSVDPPCGCEEEHHLRRWWLG